MKSTIIAIAVGGILAGALALAWTPPTTHVETDGRVFTNTGEDIELQARMIEGQPNPEYSRACNARSRVYTINGDAWEVIWRRVGVPASEHVMATGTSVCKSDEYQPVYVRARVEPPTLNLPVAEVEIP